MREFYSYQRYDLKTAVTSAGVGGIVGYHGSGQGKNLPVSTFRVLDIQPGGCHLEGYEGNERATNKEYYEFAGKRLLRRWSLQMKGGPEVVSSTWTEVRCADCQNPVCYVAGERQITLKMYCDRCSESRGRR